MDFTAEIEKAVAAITGDKAKVKAFRKDPVSLVKSIVGDSAAKELIDKIIEAVKAKIGAGGFLGKIKGLFGKK